jgi:DNA-binding HxlR family transcriptional regulator
VYPEDVARSYGQICGIAKALEVIGDRWTLLLIRELLTRGACRYTDLRNGLPGIATNLLAQRLRELDQAGIVVAEEASPPVAGVVYRLTDRGEALEPIVKAIGDWGIPLLTEVAEGDVFQTHWLLLPLRSDLEDSMPAGGPVRVQLEPGDDPIVLEAAEGRVRAYVGRAREPNLVLRASGRTLTSLLLGRIGLTEARKRGLSAEGDVSLLERLRVKALSPAS